MRVLAKAADTSDRMLLYYFKDKAELMHGVMAALEQRLSSVLDDIIFAEPVVFDALVDPVRDILMGDDVHPYMLLRLEVACLASRGDDFFMQTRDNFAEVLLSWIKRQLNSRTAIARDSEAKKLLSYVDGHLMQNMAVT